MIDRRYVCGPIRASILAFVVVGTLGCSKSKFEMAPVTGRVTIDQQPLTKGRIVFTPRNRGDGEDAGKPAFGVVQSDGTYSLATYGDNDGAIVGEHSVTVFDTSDSPKFARLKLMQSFTVTADGENTIDVALTSQDIARMAQRATQ